MLLGVLGQLVAALGHGFTDADRRQRVLQGFARAHVHDDVADRRHRQRVLPGDFLDSGAVGLVERAVQQVQADPGAAGKGRRHPRRLRVQAVDVGCVMGGIGRQQDRQAIGQLRQVCQVGTLDWRCAEIGRHQPVSTFFAAGTGDGDQFGQVAVAFAVLGQQHQRQRRFAIRVRQVEMGADNQRQRRFFRFRVGTHHAGQRTLIGQRQRRIAEPDGALHQLFGVRGTLQESKIRQAKQLGVIGQAWRGMRGRHRNGQRKLRL